MQYDTSKLTAYIEKEQIKVMAVLHDNFTHHETYVLGRTQEGLHELLVYVGPDDNLTTYCHDTASEGMAALLDTALSIFLNLTSHEDPVISGLSLAKQMRDNYGQFLSTNLQNSEHFKLAGVDGSTIVSLL